MMKAIVWGVLVLCTPAMAWAQDNDAKAGNTAKADKNDEVEDIEETEDVEVVAADATAGGETDPDENPAEWFTDAYPAQERGISQLLARPTHKHTFLFVIDHRTYQPVTENTFHDWLGYDAGNLRVGLGLRFGVLDDLDLGVYRLNDARLQAFDTYDFDARWRFLNQTDHWLDVAVRPGVTWFSQDGAGDALKPFGQLLLSRVFWNRLTVGTGVLYHADSSSELKSNKDTAWTIGVPAVLEFRVLSWMAINVESGIPLAGYRADYPNLTAAWKIITNRHTFAIVAGNTQYLGADGLLAGTNGMADAGGTRGFGNLIIGFSITRELSID